MAQSRVNEILDVAEQGIRRGGFDAVSFRDIAAAVGIKSASVHYHFPQKSDLGRAVIARYAERMMAALGAPDDAAETPRDRIARLTGAYRAALAQDGATCLCAVLGAVTEGLPEPMGAEICGFYDKILAWTRTALGDGESPISAEMIVSTLMGAMILAFERKRPQLLEEAEAMMLERIGA